MHTSARGSTPLRTTWAAVTGRFTPRSTNPSRAPCSRSRAGASAHRGMRADASKSSTSSGKWPGSRPGTTRSEQPSSVRPRRRARMASPRGLRRLQVGRTRNASRDVRYHLKMMHSWDWARVDAANQSVSGEGEERRASLVLALSYMLECAGLHPLATCFSNFATSRKSWRRRRRWR